jgi:phi LC3 family holin
MKSMKINWRVRVNNPLFWKQFIVAIFAPILTYFGVNFSQMTTWAAWLALLRETVSNPVVVVTVLVSLWNLLIDPTTKGVSDSSRAMGYVKPM